MTKRRSWQYRSFHSLSSHESEKTDVHENLRRLAVSEILNTPCLAPTVSRAYGEGPYILYHASRLWKLSLPHPDDLGSGMENIYFLSDQGRWGSHWLNGIILPCSYDGRWWQYHMRSLPWPNLKSGERSVVPSQRPKQTPLHSQSLGLQQETVGGDVLLKSPCHKASSCWINLGPWMSKSLCEKEYWTGHLSCLAPLRRVKPNSPTVWARLDLLLGPHVNTWSELRSPPPSVAVTEPLPLPW